MLLAQKLWAASEKQLSCLVVVSVMVNHKERPRPLSDELDATWEITIDTEIKAKRNNMISELIPFRITKAKAKV